MDICDCTAYCGDDPAIQAGTALPCSRAPKVSPARFTPEELACAEQHMALQALTKKLKPCPFCGGPASISSTGQDPYFNASCTRQDSGICAPAPAACCSSAAPRTRRRTGTGAPSLERFPPDTL